MNRRRSYHTPTWRQCRQMEAEGIHWTPPRDKRDNRATNFDYKEDTEAEYQEYLKSKEKSLKWVIDSYTNEDGTIDQDLYEDDYYLFLKMTPKERTELPDSLFVGDGTWNSSFDSGFAGLTVTSHKGNRYTRIRVPSLKRGKSTWQKFYNEFPGIAAEVRFGERRFINGAKLKYIW